MRRDIIRDQHLKWIYKPVYMRLDTMESRTDAHPKSHFALRNDGADSHQADDVLADLHSQAIALVDLTTLNFQETVKLERTLKRLRAQWFEGDATRVQRLMDICHFDSHGRILMATTEILLMVNAPESYPILFDKFVKLLWGMISGEQVNSVNGRERRGTVCECLKQIELVIPGSLEALVLVKEGRDRSVLASCTMEERSHAFQNYLNLFLTILSQLCLDEHRYMEAAATRLSAIGLVVESLPLLSKYARCEAIALAARILSNSLSEDGAILYTLCQHALDHIGCISSTMVIETLIAVGEKLSLTDRTLYLKRVSVCISQMICDPYATLNARIFASNLAKEHRMPLLLPTPFDDLDVALAVTEALFEASRTSPEMIIQRQSLLDLCWFCEEFYRERTPSQLSRGAFRMYRAFLGRFPDHVDEVASVLIQGAVLRGGAKFFTPLSVIAELAGENDYVYRRLIYQLADAVVDLALPEDIAGFLPLLEVAFRLGGDKSAAKRDATRCLRALERFVSSYTYSFRKWEEAMGFVECCRAGLEAIDGKSAVLIKHLVQLLERKVSDPIMKDQCRALTRSFDAFPHHSFKSPRPNDSSSGSQSAVAVETVALNQLMTLERIDETGDLPQTADQLVVKLRLTWTASNQLANDLHIQELFALSIHPVVSPSALSFTFPPSTALPSISVPYISGVESKTQVFLINDTFVLRPAFPSPVRISMRAMATKADGNIVEGPLQDIHIDFVDWWMSYSSDSHENWTAKSTLLSEAVVIVREQVNPTALAKFFRESKAGRLFRRQGEYLWSLRVLARPTYHLEFLVEHKPDDERVIVHCRSDNWVFLSYLNEIFGFGR